MFTEVYLLRPKGALVHAMAGIVYPSLRLLPEKGYGVKS